MRGLRRTLLAVGAVFVTAWVFGSVRAEEEPAIRGKPLSRWITQLRGSNRGLQVRASRALSEAPEEARPEILKKVIPILGSERQNDRFVAAQIVGAYGPMARSAVPHLLPLLEGTQFERNRAAASEALGRILKDSSPSEETQKVTAWLVPLFRDKYADVRRESVRACGMIGPAAKSCLPHLVHPLEFTLGNVARDHPYLLVRRATAWTLGRMGPLASGYVDRLIAKMHEEGDEAPEVVWAIGRIGAVHGNVAPNIVDHLEKMGRDWRRSPTSKMNAWTALETFGSKAAPAVPLIARYLREGVGTEEPSELFVRWFRILRAIGPEAAEALPGVRKWADGEGPAGGWAPEEVAAVRREAQETAARLDGK